MPLPRAARTFAIARSIVVTRSSGSPSQPWPNDTMPSGTRSRWRIAMRATSSTSASNATRVCGDGIPASGASSEMQPTHAALHFGDTGSAASPRSRKTFCAVKQP